MSAIKDYLFDRAEELGLDPCDPTTLDIIAEQDIAHLCEQTRA